MGYATRILDATVEPIDVPAIKPHLRIVDADTTHDAMLPGLIKAARRICETRTQRALISQKWRYRIDAFPCDISLVVSGSSKRYPGHIYLPRPKLLSIETFKYVDTDGNEQTLAPDVDFKFDADAEPAIVYAASGTTWPSTLGGMPGAVSIEYTAGYGAAATDVPSDLVQWIIGVVAYWFENPKALEVEPGLTASVPSDFLKDLLSESIVHHVGGSR